MLKPNLDLLFAIARNKGHKLELNGELVEVNQTNMAKLMGVTKQQFSLWNVGKSFPRAEKLYKMAHLLGCKVEELYDYIPGEESPDEDDNKRVKNSTAKVLNRPNS